MELGQFSLSLAVRDIDKSLAFYQLLGFQIIDGGHQHDNEFADTDSHKWRILQSGGAVIGLFQGMFESNIMTFNPPEVRSIQEVLKSNGTSLIVEADPESSGAAHILLKDPDGNTIMFDQHG